MLGRNSGAPFSLDGPQSGSLDNDQTAAASLSYLAAWKVAQIAIVSMTTDAFYLSMFFNFLTATCMMGSSMWKKFARP